MSSISFFPKAYSLMAHNKPFDVQTTPKLKVVEADSLSEDSPLYQERIRRIAGVFADELQNSIRISPKESLSSDEARTTRMFLILAEKTLPKDSQVMRCYREYTAFKLGVPSFVFKRNQGFANFCKRFPLERYLAVYDHRLRVSDFSQGGEVQILADGVLCPWSKIRVKENRISEFDSVPYEPWYYGQNGIQNKNMFDWEELTPYKKEAPYIQEWHLFEICCSSRDLPRLGADHFWLRLITPNGNSYSVGLYPSTEIEPDKVDLDPTKAQKSHLMSPDVSEFGRTPIHRISVAITAEEFAEMKRVIEEDKKAGLAFPARDDCSAKYVEKIAALARIGLSTSAMHEMKTSVSEWRDGEISKLKAERERVAEKEAKAAIDRKIADIHFALPESMRNKPCP